MDEFSAAENVVLLRLVAPDIVLLFGQTVTKAVCVAVVVVVLLA